MDDDNYMNLPSLLQLLSSYHHSQDVYLGRPSLDHPIEAAEKVKSNGMVSQLVEIYIHCKDQLYIYYKVNTIRARLKNKLSNPVREFMWLLYFFRCLLSFGLPLGGQGSVSAEVWL